MTTYYVVKVAGGWKVTVGDVNAAPMPGGKFGKRAAAVRTAKLLAGWRNQVLVVEGATKWERV